MVEDADGIRIDVGGENPTGILRHHQHVSTVLADAEYPVDLLATGIVAADRLASFSSEIDSASHPREAMWRTQPTEVYRRERLLGYQINDRESVLGGRESAVVGDVGDCSFIDDRNLVRILAR